MNLPSRITSKSNSFCCISVMLSCYLLISTPCCRSHSLNSIRLIFVCHHSREVLQVPHVTSKIGFLLGTAGLLSFYLVFNATVYVETVLQSFHAWSIHKRQQPLVTRLPPTRTQLKMGGTACQDTLTSCLALKVTRARSLNTVTVQGDGFNRRLSDGISFNGRVSHVARSRRWSVHPQK